MFTGLKSLETRVIKIRMFFESRRWGHSAIYSDCQVVEWLQWDRRSWNIPRIGPSHPVSRYLEYQKQAKLKKKNSYKPVLHCIVLKLGRYILWKVTRYSYQFFLFLVVLHQLLHQQISLFAIFQNLIQFPYPPPPPLPAHTHTHTTHKHTHLTAKSPSMLKFFSRCSLKYSAAS